MRNEVAAPPRFELGMVDAMQLIMDMECLGISVSIKAPHTAVAQMPTRRYLRSSVSATERAERVGNELSGVFDVFKFVLHSCLLFPIKMKSRVSAAHGLKD